MSEQEYPADTSEFEDPLENYDPPAYSDSLEQALVEEAVAAIQAEPYMVISPETSISEALEKMVGDDIACLLVAENDELVGLFSDRDVLERVSEHFDELKDQPVKEVMTADPVYVFDTDFSAAALAAMAVSGYRHVPVVDVNKKIRGIISPSRVAEFLQRNSEPSA